MSAERISRTQPHVAALGLLASVAFGSFGSFVPTALALAVGALLTIAGQRSASAAEVTA